MLESQVRKLQDELLNVQDELHLTVEKHQQVKRAFLSYVLGLMSSFNS